MDEATPRKDRSARASAEAWVRRGLQEISRISGFTLLELMVVIAIVGILSSIAIPAYRTYLEKARMTKAIMEIRMLEREIIVFESTEGRLPDSLADIGYGNLKDPWGNPYEFLNFENVQGVGKMRKNHMMVPINKFFDLYSKGPDGKSQAPLTAKASHDDIVYAGDGKYVGVASNIT
jgi:general secretion pathway protein G